MNYTAAGKEMYDRHLYRTLNYYTTTMLDHLLLHQLHQLPFYMKSYNYMEGGGGGGVPIYSHWLCTTDVSNCISILLCYYDNNYCIMPVRGSWKTRTPPHGYMGLISR